MAMNPADTLVLIVDDITSNLRVLGEILQNRGYKVTFAKNGEQALERVITARPDLILLDLMMPDIDGLEVCTRLKQNPEIQSIPVIFLTASHEPAHLLEAFSHGAVDYITKPFNAPELLARVKTHLELKYLQDWNQRQLQQERLIRSIAQGTLESLELQSLLTNTAAAVRAYFQADRVLIYQCTEVDTLNPDPTLETQPGRIVAESLTEGSCSLLGLTLEDCPWIHTSLDRSPSLVQAGGFPPHNATVQPVSAQHQETLAQWQVKAEMITPIFQRSEHWGALIIHRCEVDAPWTPEELQVITRVVEQLEVAIQQASLYSQLRLLNQELRHLANVDSLTSLANRRALDEYLGQIWKTLLLEQEPLSLLLCDIDYFKAYNDRYGHPQGDWCLQQVAQTIAQASHRPMDLAARYGGEEFAVILPYTPSEGAQQVAQRLQANLEALQIPHRGSSVGDCLTLSLGLVTVIPTAALSPQQIVDSADRALYQAKAKGRNRLEIGTPLRS